MSSKTDTIHKILSEQFKPSMLKVECESAHHNVPKGAEMHFFVGIISDKFEGQSTLNRHRMISKLVYAGVEGVHALRIHAKSPSEAEDLSEAPDAPKCLGGSKK